MLVGLKSSVAEGNQQKSDGCQSHNSYIITNAVNAIYSLQGYGTGKFKCPPQPKK